MRPIKHATHNMKNKTFLVLIDDDIDEHEIFTMAIEDLAEPIDCLYFTDCESAISHFSHPGVRPPEVALKNGTHFCIS